MNTMGGALVYGLDSANNTAYSLGIGPGTMTNIIGYITSGDAAMIGYFTVASSDPGIMGVSISGINGDWTDHRYYCNRGAILTTGGTSVLSPTLALDQYTALERPLPGVMECLADTQVTITARMKRSNTAFSCGLKIPAYSIPGLTSDVIGAVTEAADTYENVSFNFTPTETCGVVLWSFGYGTGTTHSLTIDSITAV